MRYGYFDDAAREYVITDPRTPVKWVNYIGTLEFGGYVDQTGGALLCRKDPALNRITKYITQMPSSDFKGEGLYLRLHEGQGFKVFSPFYVPTLDAFDRYEARVGLGYTRYISEFYGIRSQITVFVPENGQVEIRQVQITNLRAEPARLDAIPVVEYTHPDALKQLTNADWVPQTMTSRAIEVDGRTVLTEYPFMTRDFQINYFAASLPASSFETDRREFLGANEYGTWRAPLSLQSAELGNHQANRGDVIGALLIPLGTLQPGETRSFITLLGQAENNAQAANVVRQYCQPGAVDTAFAALQSSWNERLEPFHVTSPDPDFDRMVNVYNPRQCWTTFYWSRYLSYYQLGYGARGIGTRDSSQDVLALMASGAEKAKGLIIKLLSIQRRDGSAYHQFNPLTMVASEGDALEREDRPHYYSDDHLWGVLAVTDYIKETGDFDFLQEQVPFYDKDKQEKPIETGTVLEHIKRGLEFTRTHTGAHGLPLLGFADWNDTVNLPTGSESMFTANLYGHALGSMVILLDALGEDDLESDYWEDYEAMQKVVEEAGWDGAWYRRYYDAEGNPLGSKENKFGQIYLNAQSWAVISSFCSYERGLQAMDSVYEHLNTEFGIKLSAPGFNGFDPKVGGITTYPPGAKENGGIFLHPNPWAIIAETSLGRGDRAYQYYCQINPAKRNDAIERYECEPYVYPQNILADEHPQFGLARNSWLSGTSSWTYQAATRHILGISADYKGLLVHPCIPSAWDGFTVSRRFRGAWYEIKVSNPDHVCVGVKRIVVDGQLIEGNRIPVFAAGTHHVVEVELGKAES
ncbi:MAG: hypothetical protein VB013_07025 [Anaerolineaceae bacterium]|nr:hypothetical protein [Anaerolineaceae bacterium]